MERCESTCDQFSSLKFTQDNTCVDKCIGDKPYYIPGNICVNRCIDYKDTKFVDQKSNACVKSCEYLMYRINAVSGIAFCLENCDTGKRGVDNKYDNDIYRCEAKSKLYSVIKTDEKISYVCQSNCDSYVHGFDNSINTNMERCESTCDQFSSLKFTQDNTCVDKCIGDKPYYIPGNICVNRCIDYKDTKFVDQQSNACVKSCEYLMYRINAVSGIAFCLENCDTGKRGVDNKYDNDIYRCEANCSLFSSVKFTQDELCLDKCSGIKPYFITGNICVSQCYDQVSEKFLNEASNQCVSSCNSQTYYRNNANQFLFCSPSACAPTNFTGVELYHASYMRCESSCSAFSDLKYSDSQTCIKACSDTKKFSDSDLTCYSQCPFTLFTEGNSCVKQCATGNFSISDNTRTCENACQKYSYLDSDNMRVCVQTCPEAKPLINALTQECTATCDQPLYSILDNTVNCLTKCEFVHGIDVKFSETMERCEQSCLMFSSEKFTMNDLCVDKCTEAKPYSSTDNVCVENCYQQKSLRYVGDGNRCVSKCDFYKIIGKNIQCVKSCDQLEVRLVSQEQTFCYKDCGLQVYHPIKNECVDSCSGEYVSFSKVCMLSCPEGFQKNNNICTANKSGNKTIMLTAIGATVAILIIVVILAIIYKKRKANTKGTKKTSKVSKAGKDTMYYARRLNLDPNDKKVRNPNKVGQRVNILDEKPPKYVEMKNSVTQLKDSVSIRDSVNSRSRTASINQRRNSNSMDQFAHIQSNSSSENSQHKRKQVSSKLQTTLGEQPVW
ncbi:Conserved_hypothetical protein [Hexamita inflata]|uniref:Uncharacterized protein n=1 Tax=Hexamita inflata TaxID=28002 RepID=A0AA86UUC9_9EUKA|nr:Conserved hypothetical protein [Hexamita inflata]